MSEDYQAKFEKLVLDYSKLAVLYGELLARLSPPLPVYPQPATPYQPYPAVPTSPWIVTGGSSGTWQPPNTTQAYNQLAVCCASCNVPLPDNCYAVSGRTGLFCGSACMAVADSTAQGAR